MIKSWKPLFKVQTQNEAEGGGGYYQHAADGARSPFGFS
jgi:hypothetical protein